MSIPRQGDRFSGFVGKDRSPASVVGLSVLTLGIYFLVWHYQVNDEIRRHDPDIQVTPGLSVLAAIFPISSIVTAFCTASRIRQMQLDEGQTQTVSPVLAMLLFMFFGIGYMLYISSELQAHWRGHRRPAGGLSPTS
jgi:drug/metabolite transporter (DMT)-like permease